MTRTAPTMLSRLGRRLADTHARQELQRDLERVLAGADQRVRLGPSAVVGIASLSSGPWHLVIDVLLGHALRLRGARPELLICDMPDLPICDERAVDSRSPDRCAGCVGDKSDLLAVSGLMWQGLEAFAPAAALARARARVAAVPDSELTACQYRGWPVGQWLHVSASHYLRRDARGESAEQTEARRRLLTSAIVLLDAVAEWLDRRRPSIVLAESGAHLEWRVVFELARARGIPVICREMGKGGWDHHIYALNADAMSPDLSESWSAARETILSASEDAAVDAFVAALPERTFTAPPSRPAAPNLVEPGRRCVVAFANVTWDLATTGRDVAFAGVADWLRHTVDALAPCQDVSLILRAHPAEASVETRERIADEVMRQWPAAPSNVTVVAPETAATVAQLCERADLVAVYNSTAGLEAAVYGRPVLVCGKPHYRAKGFTIDIDSREAYLDLLRAWLDGAAIAAPPRAAELARRYVHLFFLRYHLRMGWTTSPLTPPYALTIRSIDELEPGRNKVLDAVCDGILGGRQIVMPRQATLESYP